MFRIKNVYAKISPGNRKKTMNIFNTAAILVGLSAFNRKIPVQDPFDHNILKSARKTPECWGVSNYLKICLQRRWLE